MKENLAKKIKPINLSIELKGQFAKKLIEDMNKNPSESSIKKNNNASKLLEELRR